MKGDTPDRQDEDRKARVDRELIELLNEIRVALPGVQVLFAFLLTVPISSRYESLNELQRDLILASFLCAAVATALLIAPTAHHRILFRQPDKELLLLRANYLLLAGTVFLAISMTTAVFVVTDLIIDSVWAAAAAGGLALLFFVLWYVVPLRQRVSQ